MGKTDHGDNCQGENGGVKTAWGKCLWGFTDRIVLHYYNLNDHLAPVSLGRKDLIYVVNNYIFLQNVYL